MNQPAIELRNVSKRYGERYALRDVRFDVELGQLHGLLGPNGAGKTTMMRVLLGLVKFDEGSVRMMGEPLGRAGDPLQDGVAGFVDTTAFYPYLTGRANLALLARLDNANGSSQSKVDEVLDRVGLGESADRSVSTYSAGMRQRLGLAAALLRSPRILLLDEPTSSLDPAAARQTRALARELADEGTAIVWSSHDMAEVEQLCDTLTVIDRGHVVFSGTVDDLRQRAPASVHTFTTSNNRVAAQLGCNFGLRIQPSGDGGLEVRADDDMLDGYVVALGCAGIAIRALSRRSRSLETLFLELTGDRSRGADEHEAAYNTPAGMAS